MYEDNPSIIPNVTIANLTRDYNSLLPRINSNTILEVELKYGYFNQVYSQERRGMINIFKSEVPYVYFERLKNYLEANPDYVLEITISQVATQSGRKTDPQKVRRITYSDGTVIWQRKQTIRDYDLPDYDVRLSLNSEEVIPPIPDPNFNYIRDRTRYTFTFSKSHKIDMTEVSTSDKGEFFHKYEIEIEIIDIDKLFEINNYILEYFRIIRDTLLPYTRNLKEMVNSIGTAFTAITKNNYIDKSLLVQARNLTRKDLVFGGIVGNPKIHYNVTFKADGKRKMLVIHNTGIWLIYPPYEFNLVIAPGDGTNHEDLIEQFQGTILDGELISLKDPAVEDSEYHYLAFDCFLFKNDVNYYVKKYDERRNAVEQVTSFFNSDNTLRINTKPTVTLNTPAEFFQYVKEFIDNRKNLFYPDDGLIFTPIETIYNPKSEQYGLKERILTVIPDVCKWKPAFDITIDFRIVWKFDASGVNKHLELYSVIDAPKGGNTIYSIFKGDRINPLTPDMIDYQNPLLKDLQTGTIVEFGWNASDRKLEPRRIRSDKTDPNTRSIAMNNWADIFKPITIDEITGTSFALVYRYHNRIKKDLYAKNIKDGNSILDIGSGRGGDLSHWSNPTETKNSNPNVGGLNVVAVEPNPNNYSELLKRAPLYGMQDKIKLVKSGGEDSIAINNGVKEFIKNGKVDAVTLMLSLSFFWSSPTHLQALVNTIVQNIKPGGKILFLTIDGKSVEELFQREPGVTTIKLGPAILQLQQFPKNALLIDLGPDTIVGKQLEYLVKLDDLTALLKPYGFELKQLEKANQEKLLTTDGFQFSELYSYGYYQNTNPQLLTNLPPLVNLTLPNVTTLPAVDKVDTTIKPVEVTVSPLDSTLLAPPPTSYKMGADNQVLTSTTSVRIDQVPNPEIAKEQDLPWLPVTYRAEGPALHDDEYQSLNCSWYSNLVRIATMGDGNCFIHAVLKSYSKTYQNNRTASFRANLAREIRRDLGLKLAKENPLYPGFSYWETAGKGAFPRLLLNELTNPALIKEIGVDFSLYGLQRLFNSDVMLGDEVYSFVSEVLGLDIYILRATKDNLYPHIHTHNPAKPRNGIVIIGNKYHYEVLAINKDSGLQTIFTPNDPFIQILQQQFIGNKSYGDIFNSAPFDPIQSFRKEFNGRDKKLILAKFNSQDPLVHLINLI